jgi:hypothetical protein
VPTYLLDINFRLRGDALKRARALKREYRRSIFILLRSTSAPLFIARLESTAAFSHCGYEILGLFAAPFQRFYLFCEIDGAVVGREVDLKVSRLGETEGG